MKYACSDGEGHTKSIHPICKNYNFPYKKGTGGGGYRGGGYRGRRVQGAEGTGGGGYRGQRVQGAKGTGFACDCNGFSCDVNIGLRSYSRGCSILTSCWWSKDDNYCPNII